MLRMAYTGRNYLVDKVESEEEMNDPISLVLKKGDVNIFLWSSVCKDSVYHVSAITPKLSQLYCFSDWEEMRKKLEEKEEEVRILKAIVGSKDEILKGEKK